MSDAANTAKPQNKRRNGNFKKRNNNQPNGRNNSNNNNSNNKRKFTPNKNRRPKSLTPARIQQKYDNLMEQYLTARKKYFDIFGRANQKQMDKIIKNYHMALEALRKFGSELKEDWQKEILEQKVNGLPEDRQYSTDHDLVPKGDEISFVGEFEDPHLLKTQKEHNWSNDTEESTGTMDDYHAYKGTTP